MKKKDNLPQDAVSKLVKLKLKQLFYKPMKVLEILKALFVYPRMYIEYRANLTFKV